MFIGGLLKRALTIIATLIASTSLVQFSASASPSHYLDSITTEGDDWLIHVSERPGSALHSQLVLQPGSVGEGEKRGSWIDCQSADDPTCSSQVALESILGWSLLPFCGVTSSEICIESLELARKGEDFQASKYLGESDPQLQFPAAPEKNLLRGGGMPLFESPNVNTAAGSNLFGLAIRVTQFWNFPKRQFVAESLAAELVPFYLDSQNDFWNCDIWSPTTCGQVTRFAPDTQVRLSFRMPNTIGGWFSGRLQNPDLSVEKFSSTANRLVIQSEPVEVAALGVVKSKAKFTTKENMWFENNGFGSIDGVKVTGAGSVGTNALEFIDYYRKEAKDTAIGTDLSWKLRTVPTGFASSCLSDTSKVYGLVTTNALAYEAGSPGYNNGFLDYKVAGLHYMPGGKELVIGTYDLIMDSNAARCIYGFSRAPISATVTVVGDQGAENIATTIVSERDGWLKLSAYGFTFSEKDIKVKVTQPFSRTLTKFSGSTQSLSSKQKAEIKATIAKAKNNPKFICTGVYMNDRDKVTALKRARAACNYAKSLDKNHSYWSQAKKTSAKTFDAKVLISSK